MSHWLLDSVAERRATALKLANLLQVKQAIQSEKTTISFQAFQDMANVAGVLEMVVLELVQDQRNDDPEQVRLLRETATDAFRLLRASSGLDEPSMLLRLSALAVLGDRGSDAARLLRQSGWVFSRTPDDWGQRTWMCIQDVWLRLFRKQGWEDRDAVLQGVLLLRTEQGLFESQYLHGKPADQARYAALELIGLYHLAKAAEILALFITEGVVEGNFQVQQLLDTHFDRALAACEHARMLELEPLVRLLAAAAAQMVQNSIWTVTRAVNSRVTQFVRTLVDRGRGNRALFDVLPPQRRTLAEKGLLGSSRRAVVVSLPTSSGKTLIAQFRILQALNQFETEQGWVVYLAPTKALVNQVCRQLRRDFSRFSPPITVEQVSPALEIDGIEMSLLHEREVANQFRVLVTTPEKLDLMIRQGIEQTIQRPLTLVVVDEAHNLQGSGRGLKLELLLATINKECQQAQFLLLTPFINNAREIARWLGGQNSDDISLALDWQPNDRIIGVVEVAQKEKLNKKSSDYSLRLNSVHTTRNTIIIDELLHLPAVLSIAKTQKIANNNATLAALTAQNLSRRGGVIVMHERPDWVWSLAKQLQIPENQQVKISANIKIVQDYIKLEMGNEFPLVELLNFGIGIHHGGLPDDVRSLIEWLFEEEELRFLVATTTIAQGVNFPVSAVVLASHRYPGKRGKIDMPPEDFWNIAGRAGRISQGQLGVVALVAKSPEHAVQLENFINQQTGDLNSALVKLAQEAGDWLNDLGGAVYRNPEWSSFLQYLTHTYRQQGEPAHFADQIEQVLRGTFGFDKLRMQDNSLARVLLTSVEAYVRDFQKPNQPLKLVDSTGFSLQSIKTILSHKGDLNKSSWNAATLFSPRNEVLKNMMGVLLRVPELRDNLQEVTGEKGYDGEKLAEIIKDWVGGASLPDIAQRHFQKDGRDDVDALTKCGQNLFGKLAQTASWGMGALLAITAADLPEAEFRQLSNLPSRVFYGVNTDAAIALRLLGVPRSAATPLANWLGKVDNSPLPHVRQRLAQLNETDWKQALGKDGDVYRKVWRVLEGLSPASN